MTTSAAQQEQEQENCGAWTENGIQLTQDFYQVHSEIKASHSWNHVKLVYQHACLAIECHEPPLTPRQAMEVKIAALLHDVDDTKYFPGNQNYENAHVILGKLCLPLDNCAEIVNMISLVSCSQNGNSVPNYVSEDNQWYLLIPRWADRLEAVGARGVIRCYQYNAEHDGPLSSSSSPRPRTEAEVWQFATPERFEQYQSNDKHSSSSSSKTETKEEDDMISHYYDKLLHVARPPPGIVRNSYLEQQAKKSAEPLVKVCLDFGLTGKVNEFYIQGLMTQENARGITIA
jgi:uncharacterized protein